MDKYIKILFLIFPIIIFINCNTLKSIPIERDQIISLEIIEIPDNEFDDIIIIGLSGIGKKDIIALENK
jgi:hypothetical protein